MWATHGPFICLNTLALPQSVLYHAGYPKERKAHMQGTLQVKKAPGYIMDDGTAVPEHDLYRFVDEHGKGGCWYAKVENAQRSWERAHAAPTEAQVAADALLAEYDMVVSPTTRRLLAVAYTRGATAAATEAAATDKAA